MTRSSKKPDILILMSDQHSKHFLGCYGNSIVRTPNLDRFAAEGMLFSNRYCPSPLCGPSRMSFMTSRAPSRNRVWHNTHVLPSGIPTWAHLLGAAEYQTDLIGRMHFMGSDQRHGFENRSLGEYTALDIGSPEQGTRWITFPEASCGQSRKGVEIAGKGTTTYQWFDEQVADATCKFLREKSGEKNRRLFAAVSGFVLPHCPFIAPKDLFDYYYLRVDIPSVEENQPPSIVDLRGKQGILDPPLSEERVHVARAAYYALCEYFDSLTGKILDCLRETGLAENTLVIYYSDHGEMAGDYGYWWKLSYYEGSAGIPLIARFPGVIGPSSVSDAVCNLIDVAPTIVEAAGADPMPGIDGRSLWPIMQGEHSNDRVDETYSEVCYYEYPSRMIRSGKWKLWVHEGSEKIPPALFNIEDDPRELNNLGSDPEFAGIREELIGKLYSDWDPEFVRSASREAKQDYNTLFAWGSKIKPKHPDTLPLPPSEIESDVELL